MIDRATLKELLHYDPESGIFTWKERPASRFKTVRAFKMWNTRYAGARAGSEKVNSNGYLCRRIKLEVGDYYEHRLAWLWMTGKPAPEEVDHKNHDATDNRWRNLRASSRIENSHNSSRRKDNTSGVTGVTWKQDCSKWVASCMVEGKRHRLGLFHNIEEAALEILEFRADHGFDISHGLELAHYHSANVSHHTG